jgi:dGTPase
LRAFIHDLILGTLATGKVAMTREGAEALAAFRAFNYERIYLRPASVEQGQAVIRLLRSLTDRYLSQPELLPASHRPAELTASSIDAARAAVTYVGGMTDRFAFRNAIDLLGWEPSQLPQGIDIR